MSPRRFFAALLPTLTLAAAATPAVAVERSTGPLPEPLQAPFVRTMTLPVPASSAGRPDVSAPAATALAPNAAPSLTLQPLTLPAGGAEMAGESGLVEIPLWLTAAQASAVRAVQVSFRASVSVRPEGSSLTVRVNDLVAGRVAVFAPTGWQTIRLDLPEQALRPGFNRISFAADMRHRVDCSVPATFELWTRLDPTATGLLVAGTPRGPAAPEELPALPGTPDGTVPIRIVLPGKLRPSGVDAVLQLAQAVALAVGDRPLEVDFGAAAGGPAGANLVLGSAEDLAAAGISGAGLQPGTPALLPATPERRATLAVLAEGQEDLARAVAMLQRIQAGRSRPAWPGAGRALVGDERVTLREFGVQTREFGGRVPRTSFDITMPADLLPADYGSIILAVDGATAAGLAPEAQLRVEVNGRHVAAAPLTRSTGEALRGFPIHLPLSVFRPGRNTIVLAANLPTLDDSACSPAGTGGAERPRFLLLDSTALVVPRLAYATRVPELSQLAGGALPFQPGRDAWLVAPAPDRDSMAAAATLAARLAQAAGGVIPFRLQATLPPPDDLDRLFVTSQGVIDPVLAGSLSRVRWSLPQPPGDKPAGETSPSRSTGFQSAGLTQPPKPDWAARWPGVAPEPSRSFAESVSTVLRSAGRELSRTLDGWIADGFRQDALGPAEASLILAEVAQPRGGTVVLVAAATPQSLNAGVSRLVRRETWDRIEGAETRLLGPDVVVVRQAQRFALAGVQATPGNVRLVLAGWLSLNPSSFGGAALVLALALALATGLVLRRFGRPSA